MSSGFLGSQLPLFLSQSKFRGAVYTNVLSVLRTLLSHSYQYSTHDLLVIQLYFSLSVSCDSLVLTYEFIRECELYWMGFPSRLLVKGGEHSSPQQVSQLDHLVERAVSQGQDVSVGEFLNE